MSTLLTHSSEKRAALGRPQGSGRAGRGIAATPEVRSPEDVGLDPAGAQAGGRLTLEQRLESVWEGLHAGGAPDCPVCQAALGPLEHRIAARCGSCGSLLS